MSKLPRPSVLLALLGSLFAAAPALAKVYTLPELIELAHNNNPGLAANALQTSVIEAQLAEARRSWFPSGEVLSVVAPSPNIECDPELAIVRPNGPLSPPLTKEEREKNCYRTNDREVSLRWNNLTKGIFTRTEVKVIQPIYSFGKISTGIEAAKRGIEASRGREAAATADLDLNVKQAYWGWKAAREAIEILNEGMGHIKEGEKKIEANIKEGEGSPTDKYRIRVARIEANRQLALARQKVEIAKGALRTLVGRIEGELEIDDEPLEPLPVVPHPVEHYLEQARVARPEVIALRNLVGAQRALAELEWRKMLPDIVVIGAFNYAYASSVDNPYFAFAADPYNTLSAGIVVALRAPLDFGTKSARWAQARARADETVARQSEAAGGIDLAVKKAYADLIEATERRAILAEGEKEATKWLTAVSSNFEIGIAEAKDFSEPLLPYFNFRLSSVAALYDFNVAAARLSRETGVSVTEAVSPKKPSNAQE